MRFVLFLIFLVFNQYNCECKSGYKAKVKIGYKSGIDGRLELINPNLEEVLYFDEKYIYYKKGESKVNVFIKNLELSFIETDRELNYGFDFKRARNPLFSAHPLNWVYTGNILMIGNRECYEVKIFSIDSGKASNSSEYALAYVDKSIPSNNMLLGAAELPGFIVQLEMNENRGNERRILIRKFLVEEIEIPNNIQKCFDDIETNSFYSLRLKEPIMGDENIPTKIMDRNSHCFSFDPKLRLVSNFMFDFKWPTDRFKKYSRFFNGKEMFSVSTGSNNKVYSIVKGRGIRKDSVIIEFDALDNIKSIKNTNEILEYSIDSDTICFVDSIFNISRCYHYDVKENSITTYSDSEFSTKSTFDSMNRIVKAEYDTGDYCSYEYNECQLIKESWNLDTNNSSVYEYYENGLMKRNSSVNSNWEYEYEIIDSDENSFVLLVLASTDGFRQLRRNTYNKYGDLIEMFSIDDSTIGEFKMWNFEYSN